MSVQSMTGFARMDGKAERLSWVWELRSVNGKGLDIRVRIPQGFEDIEAKIRKIASLKLGRGNIQVSLQINDEEADTLPKINESFAVALHNAARDLQKKIGGELPSLSDLMMIKGVVSYEGSDLSSEELNARNSNLLSSFEVALQQLVEMRVSEGNAIREVLLGQLESIENKRCLIDTNEARSEKEINKRLARQVKRLLESGELADEERLYQEAVILAAKVDLQEEIDRLEVHVTAARELLSGEGPVGRRLDFLAQEFNRECNTICSKSNAAEVTTLGLDMKILIDQFREQVQNLE